MANTGGGKMGKGGGTVEKTAGTDTINFTYSSAVEAALEQLEKDMEEEANPTPRKKKTPRNSPRGEPPVSTTETKSKQKIEVYKLDEIYSDLCQLRELNTPSTSSRIQHVNDKLAAPNVGTAPPTARSGGQHHNQQQHQQHQQQQHQPAPQQQRPQSQQQHHQQNNPQQQQQEVAPPSSLSTSGTETDISLKDDSKSDREDKVTLEERKKEERDKEDDIGNRAG